MGRWALPWRRRAERRRGRDQVDGEMRQESAIAIAELRNRRRSLEAAIAQMMQTQAERAEEDE